ncbi:hypothetical protein V2J09_009144 [Rumex salicifolius]
MHVLVIAFSIERNMSCSEFTHELPTMPRYKKRKKSIRIVVAATALTNAACLNDKEFLISLPFEIPWKCFKKKDNIHTP